ncbi:unnamed protein product [Alternaria alternata]|nr:hypothetical protein B0T12DRAFT_486623 [Alternaria alternata]OWY49345.1 hypothetical protein AALT_g10126 [Alternaria alternata]RYN95973.1 hypothetical protein AA0120_g3341 [Alternaria tenuissima]
MAVQCPDFSFTKPRRLPRRRIRPSKAAFRDAVAHLDSINRRAGKFLVPAIVELLNDEKTSPEDEYRMVNDAAQKALGMNSDSTTRNRTERRRLGKMKAVSESSPRQRRVVLDSDDEENDTLSARSSPSSEKIGKRKRSVIPPPSNTKRQSDGFLSNADIDNGQKVMKPKRPRQDLNAELEDLGINMEGWTASEDASRTLRRRK